MPGDRFVVRRLSPVETIGGGAILDPLWPPIRRPASRRSRGARSPGEGALSERRRRCGSSRPGRRSRRGGRSRARAGVSREEIRAAAGRPARRRPRARVAAISRAVRSERTLSRVSADRARVGDRRGLRRGERIGRRAARDAARAALAAAPIRGGPRPSRRRSSRAASTRSPARRRGLRDATSSARRRARPLRADRRGCSARRGLDPPSLAGRDAARSATSRKSSRASPGYLVKKGTLAASSGRLADRAGGRGRRRPRGCADRGKRTSIDVGEFKEMFGLTRRLAIPLLEHLDATQSHAPRRGSPGDSEGLSRVLVPLREPRARMGSRRTPAACESLRGGRARESTENTARETARLPSRADCVTCASSCASSCQPRRRCRGDLAAPRRSRGRRARPIARTLCGSILAGCGRTVPFGAASAEFQPFGARVGCARWNRTRRVSALARDAASTVRGRGDGQGLAEVRDLLHFRGPGDRAAARARSTTPRRPFTAPGGTATARSPCGNRGSARGSLA